MNKENGKIPDRNNSPICNYVQEFKAFPRQFLDPDIRLLKIRPNEKEALEKNWNTKHNYGAKSQDILNWVLSGGNYGVTSPLGFCCFVDADPEEIQDSLDNSLPKTFRWSTGKEGHFQYAYFIQDGPIGCVPLKDGAYIKGKGGYVVGPGSLHPNGTVYGSREIRDIPIAIIKKQELLSALSKFVISAPRHTERNKRLPVGSGKVDREEIIRTLRPYWVKADGKRNEFTLAIAGFIARSGGTEEDATFVISELTRLTGKGHDHIPGAKYAFRREGPVKGFSSLEKLMEELLND